MWKKIKSNLDSRLNSSDIYNIIKFRVNETLDLITNICTGYQNILLSYLNLMDDRDVRKYYKKKALCTSACPLRGKMIGIDVCDRRKELDSGIRGCGCVIKAKLWSASKCPMGKF